MQGTLLLIIAIAAITKIIRDTLKIRNLGTVAELAGRVGAQKKGARHSRSLSASLSGSPKGGGGLLSHLVGQYHRRGRA